MIIDYLMIAFFILSYIIIGVYIVYHTDGTEDQSALLTLGLVFIVSPLAILAVLITWVPMYTCIYIGKLLSMIKV